jgi:hypothetical protein
MPEKIKGCCRIPESLNDYLLNGQFKGTNTQKNGPIDSATVPNPLLEGKETL